MPGLIGVVQRAPEQDVRVLFDTLLAPMRRNSRVRSDTCVAADGRWALGRVQLDRGQANSCPTGADDIRVFFHGDLHNEAALRASLEMENIPLPAKGVDALLATLYRLYGRDIASRLQGAFCAAVVDEKTKQLVLINDRLGSYFLYWFNGPQRFVFAPELKAVLRDPAIKAALDPRAVADYLTFGFLLGDKTLTEQVQLLPAASTLTYNWADGGCRLERYWNVEEMFQGWEGDQTEYVAALRQAFNAAVQRALAGDHKVGMSLSGGLDSRAILSAIDCGHLPISTYTLGIKGCADEVIARKLARRSGTQHRFCELDGRYLGEFIDNLQKMVALTDGMYLTHGLTEMLALQFLEDVDFAVLLRGHGGELAKTSLAWPLHTDARIHHMDSAEELIPYLLGRVNYISGGVSLRELFTEPWYAQVAGEARCSLEASLAKVRLSPADLCSYLYLMEHHRRFTVASLELFRSQFDVWLPFVDHEFLTVLFRAPSQWRDGTAIHRAIIGGNDPALLKVRNSNTGAPGGAGPMLEAVLDKLNSLGKRLNLYGYRHYHNFEGWMKRTLIESVETVLLEPDSLTRDMYRQETLRRMMEETKRGHADHSYLFQIFLILELWQREYL